MSNDNFINTMATKTMGDFLQIMTFLDDKSYAKLFSTFDIICGEIASIFSQFVIIENKTLDSAKKIAEPFTLYLSESQIEQMKNNRQPLTFSDNDRALQFYLLKDIKSIPDKELRDIVPAELLERMAMELNFGKKRGNIATLTTKQLKEKLKLVGIKITKMIKGKRKPLTRKELENKAMSFRKLQLKAKSLGIRLKYKSKNG